MANDILDSSDLIAESRHLVRAILMAAQNLSPPDANAIAMVAMMAIEKLEQAEAILAEEREGDARAG